MTCRVKLSIVQIGLALALLGATSNVHAGLVAHWKLGDGVGQSDVSTAPQTVSDSSGNGLNGVLGSSAANTTNDAHWRTNVGLDTANLAPVATLGSVMGFAGNGNTSADADFANFNAHAGTFQALSEGTIALWARLDNSDFSSGPQVLFGASDSGDGSSELRFFYGEGSSEDVRFGIRNDASTLTAIDTADNILTADEWHHLAVAVDSSGTKIYVDGVLSASGVSTAFFDDVAGIDSVLMGSNVDSGGPQWALDGKLSDVRIYDSALSAGSIAFLADSNNLGQNLPTAPEPSTIGLALFGLLSTGAFARRRRVRTQMSLLVGLAIALPIVIASSSANAALILHSTMDNVDVGNRDAIGDETTAGAGVQQTFTVFDIAGTVQNGSANTSATHPNDSDVSGGNVGQINQALDFEGGINNGNVDYGNVHNVGTGSYTVSLWVNAADDSSLQYVVNKGNNSSSAETGWSFFIQDELMHLRTRNTAGERNQVTRSLTGETDEWHHFALVIDNTAGTTTGYFDGLSSGPAGSANGWTPGFDGVTFTPGSSYTSGESLLLGMRPNLDTEYEGLIDDLAIWDEALGAADISRIYNNGLAGLNVQQAQATAPEPASFVMMVMALVGLGFARRGRNR